MTVFLLPLCLNLTPLLNRKNFLLPCVRQSKYLTYVVEKLSEIYECNETEIIDRLWELEQSNVISFNDMEYDVAAKVMHVASNKYLLFHGDTYFMRF